MKNQVNTKNEEARKFLIGRYNQLRASRDAQHSAFLQAMPALIAAKNFDEWNEVAASFKSNFPNLSIDAEVQDLFSDKYSFIQARVITKFVEQHNDDCEGKQRAIYLAYSQLASL